MLVFRFGAENSRSICRKTCNVVNVIEIPNFESKFTVTLLFQNVLQIRVSMGRAFLL